MNPAVEPGSVEHLSQIISHVVAPAFLLGAVASFISILVYRMTAAIERAREIGNLPEDGHARAALRADLPRLLRRIELLNQSVRLAIASGVVATLLIILAFAAALLGSHHVWIAACLFMLSMSLLCASLIAFAFEVRIGISEYDRQ